MRKLIATPVGRIAALVTVLALCLLGAQAATVTATARTAAGTTADRTVAHTAAGTLTSRIVGTTSNGRQVTGAFVPLHFSKRNGKVFARGLVQGVVHNRNGSTSTFSQLRTLRVRSINGTPARAGRVAARATCGILHLVLGPLHLDLLGLHVDLNRVVLNVTAESGPGNLLGNLLCAVAHLLDNNSTLQGLLGRLTTLLNQILGNLRLG